MINIFNFWIPFYEGTFKQLPNEIEHEKIHTRKWRGIERYKPAHVNGEG